MPKIEFLVDYTVKDDEGAKFKAGEVVDLPEPSANHFINRGVARIATEKKTRGKSSGKDSVQSPGGDGGE